MVLVSKVVKIKNLSRSSDRQQKLSLKKKKERVKEFRKQFKDASTVKIFL